MESFGVHTRSSHGRQPTMTSDSMPQLHGQRRHLCSIPALALAAWLCVAAHIPAAHAGADDDAYTNLMPIGDCRRMGFVNNSKPVYVLQPIAPLKVNHHCWQVVNNQPQDDGSLNYTLWRRDGSQVIADLSQLNQLNFPFTKGCVLPADLKKLEAWLIRGTWSNGAYRRTSGTSWRLNNVTGPLDRLRYFVQSSTFATNGAYKLALSIVLPTGLTFDDGDTICLDKVSMACVPRALDGSGRIEYVFYLKGEKYCPVLLTSLFELQQQQDPSAVTDAIKAGKPPPVAGNTSSTKATAPSTKAASRKLLLVDSVGHV